MPNTFAKTFTFAAAATLTCAGLASGQLIAADSFADSGADPYSINTGLGGQNATTDVVGFTGAWSVGSANIQPTDVTLELPPVTDAYASGGKGRYIASGFNAFRRGFRELSPYAAPTGDLYMSFLVNPGGSFTSSDLDDTNGFAGIGFTNFFDANAFNNAAGSSNVFGLQVGYQGDGTGEADGFDLVLRARDSSGDLVNTTLAPGAQGVTSLVILKATPTAAADPVTFWVNPTDVSSEAALDSTALQTGTVSTFAFNSGTDIDRLNVLTTDWARSFFYDEPRLGYDLASVTGVVPEPVSLALLGVAGLGLLRRRA